MSNMWNNCFAFDMVTIRYPVFQNCKEIFSPSSCSFTGDINKP